MKRMSRSLFVAACLVLTGTAWTAEPETNVNVTKSENGASVQGTSKVTATIVGIDAATRTVTLKTRSGKVIELEVTDEVRNFDQLAVGDTVKVAYHESLSLSLLDKKSEASRTESQSAERAVPGAKPGGTVGREVTVIADVVAVNAKTQMVMLKGPKGDTIDLHVEDPERLKRIKKGDQIKAVYTEALAVSVEPAKIK
jgi:Cu/Ag efflux protein CusF